MDLTIIGIYLAIYFVPSLIAIIRSHHQQTAIFILNLFLGWSGIGWVAALVWAATATRGREVLR